MKDRDGIRRERVAPGAKGGEHRLALVLGVDEQQLDGRIAEVGSAGCLLYTSDAADE